MECQYENGTHFDCDTPLHKKDCPASINITYSVDNFYGNKDFELERLVRTGETGETLDLTNIVLEKRGSLIFEPLDNVSLSEQIFLNETLCVNGRHRVRLFAIGRGANYLHPDPNYNYACRSSSPIEVTVY